MVNVVISTVPLYMLSLYKIPVKVRKRIDTIRCKFFWQDSSNHKKKIALVAWKKLCLPKEIRGAWYFRINPAKYSFITQMVVEIS
jgi:hypothetical protein